MASSYLTREGYEKAEKELETLRLQKRKEVAERLQDAMEDGELIENAEYEAAKNEQAFVEGEILRLETILSTAQIIEATGSKEIVGLGSMVTVVEKGSKEKEMYHLVGSAEANPRDGKISVESPVGKALMGAKLGGQVKVQTPDGETIFVVKSIT